MTADQASAELASDEISALIKNGLVRSGDAQIFISHSHEDRVRATALKDVLRTIGLEGFVAHEDIEPSTEWQDEILRHLQTCRGLLVLASESARSSPWVNQEIGGAVVRGIGIVSISVDCAPFGFPARRQAAKWRETASQQQFDLRAAAEANVPALFKALETVGVVTKNHLIEGLGACWSFEEARIISQILSKSGELDPIQSMRIVKLAVRNQNISGCWEARRLLPPMLQEDYALFEPADVDRLDANQFVIPKPKSSD